MTCRICRNSDTNKTYVAREMMFGYRTEFTYFQCTNCGCLQIAEIPADLSVYYPVDYYSYQADKPEESGNSIKEIFRDMRTRFAVTGRGIVGRVVYALFPASHVRALSRLRLTTGSSILDVGCGGGKLLHDLREIGFRNILGIDPFNANDIQYPNGLAVLKKTIHDVAGPWDLVMFHHSFEHVTDPAETLQSVARILADTGTCLIRVPVVSCHAWDHYGVNWVQLDAPRHQYLHTPKSIAVLAEQAGLEIQDTVYDSTEFQFWGSEQYMRDIPLTHERSWARNPGQSPFTRGNIRIYRKMAQKLNAAGKGDSALFFLKIRTVDRTHSNFPAIPSEKPITSLDRR